MALAPFQPRKFLNAQLATSLVTTSTPSYARSINQYPLFTLATHSRRSVIGPSVQTPDHADLGTPAPCYSHFSLYTIAGTPRSRSSTVTTAVPSFEYVLDTEGCPPRVGHGLGHLCAIRLDRRLLCGRQLFRQNSRFGTPSTPLTASSNIRPTMPRRIG